MLSSDTHTRVNRKQLVSWLFIDKQALERKMVMHKLHPQIEPYVQAVLAHHFGLEHCPATIYNAFSNKPINNWEENLYNEVVFEVPFAGQQIRWQFSFNFNDFTVPPDILAEDDFFEKQPVELIKQLVPSLGKWQPNDPFCLLNLLLELLELYQYNQVGILKEDENLHRYAFEYETLVAMRTLNTSDVEVSVRQGNRGTVVEFFLRIDLDISELPIPEPEPPRPLALLLVTYQTYGDTIVEIRLWDDLEALIGRIEVPDLPVDTSLIDYVPHVQNMLQGKIKMFFKSTLEREKLFCAVAALIEPAILDADSESYSKLTFFVRYGMDEAVLCIELPSDFPNGSPLLSILRVGEPVINVTDFSFKSSWGYKEMANAIVSALCQKSVVRGYSWVNKN